MSNPKIELHIQDHGVITLELDAEKAPKTVANFLQYVNDKHYDMELHIVHATKGLPRPNTKETMMYSKRDEVPYPAKT